jgi:hypothetical protein
MAREQERIMSIASSLYGGDDVATKIMFGENARHVPMWMYVQDQGTQDGQRYVSFVGASKVGADTHPLRYGSERVHQFVLGEIIVRPHLVIATDTLQGMGLAGLATNGHDLRRMLTQGELLLCTPSARASLREQGEL